MNICKPVEIFLTHLTSSRVFAGWYLAIFFLTWMVCPSAIAFDRVENWGFDQGGGYRMGSFTGEDTGLVVTCMESGHSQNNTLLAIGGALGDQWAVRIYSVEDRGPQIIAQWTGDGEKELPFSTITSMAWANGSLACGVEYLNGDEMNAGILFLDHENPSALEFSELIEDNRPRWESITSVKAFTSEFLQVLGTKSDQEGNRFHAFEEWNLTDDKIEDKIDFMEMSKTTDFIFHDDVLWICGEDKKRSVVLIFNSNGQMMKKKFHYVSAITNSGDNVFITGRRSSPQSMEDFFLICLQAKEIGNGEFEIDVKWESRPQNVGGVPPDREVGVSLLPSENGGVVVAGNFRRYWKLRGKNPNDKLALLPPDPSEGVNFEAFLARYSSEGKLEWAQTSNVPGDDFAVDLTSDGQGGAIFLGNNAIGGGFGPYLSKVQLDGDSNKNVAMVDPSKRDAVVIAWDPPKTLRLGEPLGSQYLSARTSTGDEFVYQLNGEEIKPGDLPFFEPGNMEISARLPNQQKEVTREISGLKGRPYLTITYEQVENNVSFFAELSGLHPEHFTDENKTEELLESVEYELIKGDETRVLEGSQLFLENAFTGRFEISAFFPGNTHYESASRKIFLQARNGKVFKPGEENSDAVTLQVKDLDGWQTPKTVSIGEESFISATQGFGRKRKFKGWMEFSEDDQKLRTARVQSPFSLRTALVAEEDMTLFAKYNFTFAGAAVNGYLAGSTVFLDYNLNGELDEGEPTGFTTSNGGFEIEVSEEDILANDTNQNGILDITEGVIVVLGGMDQASGLPLAISYKAPPSYSVITAVSTVVAEIGASGKSLEEAEQIISQYLELPEGIELSTFEPLGEIFTNEEEAQEFILKATQLSNLLNEGSKFLQMTTGNKVDRVDSSSLIISAISEEILQRVENDDGLIAQEVNMADPDFLKAVIIDADQQAQEMASQANEDEDSLFVSTSVRAKLTDAVPDIAENGNLEILDQLIGQVTSANVALDELAKNPEISAENFKAFASATQNVLDELGEISVNTLTPEEVQLLEQDNNNDLTLVNEIIFSAVSVEDLAGNEEDRELEREQKFSFDELENITNESQANVFAPRLLETKLFAENSFTDNLVIGDFLATDPEGSEVAYSIIGENPDLDGDGIPMFFIQESTGQVRVQDYDDLKLMDSDTVSPIIRIMDNDGLFSDQIVEIDITEWTYLAGRKRLADFNSGDGLSVRELMPEGTLIGQLVTNDPDDGELAFSLVDGDGVEGNQFFSLSENGILTSLRKFDYQKDTSFDIRVKATDQNGETHEKVVLVEIEEGFAPIIDTATPYYIGNGAYWVGGTLLDEGISKDTIETGILISYSPIIIGLSGNEQKYVLEVESLNSFGMEFVPDVDRESLYTVAYAKNEKGTSYGLVEKLNIEAEDSKTPGFVSDSYRLKGSPGWWESKWFGIYYLPNSNNWIFHRDLGWVYPSKSANNGLWLWKKSLGWLWTMENIYPFLYSNSSDSWLYFYGNYKNTRLMYDYGRGKWMSLEVSGL